MRETDYRQKCLSEKEERCIICDTEKNIVVHHVDGDKRNHDLLNLVPMCRSCHSCVHANADGYETWFYMMDEERRRSNYE